MVTNRSPDVLIEVTSRHHQVSDRTRAHATDKASKLLRFHKRISRIQIVMDRNKDDREIEMIVHVDSGRTFVARETGAGFKAALDQLINKMERQLKKDNQRRKHHKGGHGHKGQPDAGQPPGADRDEESYDDVVRKNLGT
ncbi:MAG: ribosome hibernation-promoting factor, HPF/YfiA family [Planctomycetota bacterium]|jgi:ribosomal subunit interface protein